MAIVISEFLRALVDRTTADSSTADSPDDGRRARRPAATSDEGSAGRTRRRLKLLGAGIVGLLAIGKLVAMETMDDDGAADGTDVEGVATRNQAERSESEPEGTRLRRVGKGWVRR